MEATSILITGASGFVGRHLLNHLAVREGYRVYTTDRDFSALFPNPPEKLDWLIHLASSHREAEEHLVYENNKKINRGTIELLSRFGLKPNILFTSSVHENKDNYYGQSKREGASYLESVCDKWGSSFEKIVFPNLFGPYSKPYHTSVVANFCSDIISGKESYINEVEIKLLYIREAIDAIMEFRSKEDFETTTVFLPELYEILNRLHTQYHTSPFRIALNNKFESQLLTTLTSYY